MAIFRPRVDDEFVSFKDEGHSVIRGGGAKTQIVVMTTHRPRVIHPSAGQGPLTQKKYSSSSHRLRSNISACARIE